jgi:hypothetical protein
MNSSSYFDDKRCNCSRIRRIASMVAGGAGLLLGTAGGIAIDGLAGGAIGAAALTPLGLASGWYNHSLLSLCR